MAVLKTCVTTVVVGIPADEASAFENKYEKLKLRAKVFNAAAALFLCIVSASTFVSGNSHCNPMLIRVVMCWMSAIGMMLLLAELHVGVVLTYIHVLSYRSGRALIALMAGSITLSAAPNEIPMCATPSNVGPLYLRHLSLTFACGSGMLLAILRAVRGPFT